MLNRNPKNYGLDDLADLINFGASPRATINLNLAARAHAFMEHRAYVTPEDVQIEQYPWMYYDIESSLHLKLKQIIEDISSEDIVNIL